MTYRNGQNFNYFRWKGKVIDAQLLYFQRNIKLPP